MKKLGKISLSTRSAWTGFCFVLPFVLGFLFYFLWPLVQSFTFVFSNVTVGLDGYTTAFAGWKNLHYIFRENTEYTTNLITSLLGLLWTIPIILSALFFAIILNQKFRGRTVVRAIFFLPVIIGSGVVISIIQNDAAASSVMTGNMVAGGISTQSDALKELLVNSGINSAIISFITTVIDNLFSLMWKTGIQMILFLAGLQSIPSTLYEASSIEGATAWESFWKITLPMLSPIILLNLIYSIVDSFTDANSNVMGQVTLNAQMVKYGWSSAMSWVYFLLMGIVILLVLLIFRKIIAGEDQNNY
jgi:ABC-type sugar transport system permease subunit